MSKNTLLTAGPKRRSSSKSVRRTKAKKMNMGAIARAYGTLISQEERDIDKMVDYIKQYIVAK